MDEDRRVRFYVAPILAVASLLWGASLDACYRHTMLGYVSNINDLSKLLGFAAAGGFVVFALGYAIGTITYFILGTTFRLRSKICPHKSRYHEVSLSDRTLEILWKELALPQPPDKREQELSAAVTFDHGFIRKNYEGAHLWLVRRWSAFSIGATSSFGLLLSLGFGHCNPLFHVPFRLWWDGPVSLLTIMLGFVAIWAWRDTMRLLTFLIEMTLSWREERVRQGAYDLWVKQGKPEGKAVEHWSQAEAALAAERDSRWA
jgi:hypothetical protein